jgi:hypothetical protein
VQVRLSHWGEIVMPSHRFIRIPVLITAINVVDPVHGVAIDIDLGLDVLLPKVGDHPVCKRKGILGSTFGQDDAEASFADLPDRIIETGGVFNDSDRLTTECVGLFAQGDDHQRKD